MSRLVLTLHKDLAVALRSGHPWIYDRALARPPRPLRPAELVELSSGGQSLAVGFCDPDSPIAVRVLDRRPGVAIDEPWVRERVASAVGLRRGDPRLSGTNAYRLIHGENDFLPGLVVDAYAGTAVMACDGEAATRFWRPHAALIAATCRELGVPIERVWLRQRGGPGEPLVGDPPPVPIAVCEHGAQLEVDVVHGQKTGLFLDQRDNRRLVGELAAGVEVLNLFSYTGGFSVHAALGGATRVTTVDVAEPVIAAARRNFVRNRLDADHHRFVVADGFDFLEQAWRDGRRFGLVVCDPPSFAKSKRAKSAALSAYRRLNARALGVVERGGVLVTASCSSHVTADEFLAVVGEAGARAGRTARVRQILGAASDHPIRAEFPEGRYLKALVVYVD
jgi:23S rRNA (cytosine1962-C5)-methyltransferase